jgi:uncharacterized membrane protein YedE/YeeE
MDILWIGFIVGFLLGVVIERGFYCFYLALSNFALTRDYRLIKATIWAFLVTMIGFHALHTLGIQKLDPKTFFLGGSIIGAILFGLGMSLTGSCIVGTPMRAWRGQVGYMIALLGMAVGGWLAIFKGPLVPIVKALQKPTEVLINGKVATLDRLLGINHWILVIIVAILLIWWLIKIERKEKTQQISQEKSGFFKGTWGPVFTGIALGIVEIIAFASGKSPAGLGGFIKGYATIFNGIFTHKIPLNDWGTIEVIGIMVGAVLSAIISGDFRIKFPPLKRIPALFFGGMLMGIGAVLAVGGCNVAHLISHVPQFSIGSIVSMIFIIGTAYPLIKWKAKG